MISVAETTQTTTILWTEFDSVRFVRLSSIANSSDLFRLLKSELIIHGLSSIGFDRVQFPNVRSDYAGTMSCVYYFLFLTSFLIILKNT